MVGGHGGVSDVGESVLSTGEYAAAQKTVSKLIAGDVPAKDISIVGIGVRTVEKVTGRLGFASAARSGAVNGVLFGMFFGAILLLTTPDAPVQLFAGFLFIGVAIGMCLSLVSFSIIRRRRDYASVTQLAADAYEVRVQAASLAKAREVLGAGRPEATRAAVNLDEPPRYGERIAPAGAGSAPPGSGAPADRTVAPEAAADAAPSPDDAPSVSDSPSS